MLSRRRIVNSLGALSAAALTPTGAQTGLAKAPPGAAWFMPQEHALHQRTWMAFGASAHIWGKTRLPAVQQNLAAIALAIARYEPVSVLVRAEDLPLAKALMGRQVELLVCPLDDLWLRDTGPVFVVTANGDKAAIDFNFNGWGGKQHFTADAQVAGQLARQADVSYTRAGLVLEGGAIEVDGEGTAILTESCVLNDNRNPGWRKAECERALKQLLGLEKILWLPGIRDHDITDGHTDFYARFARPGVVVAGFEPDAQAFDHAVTQRHLGILRAATDARGRRLEVHVLQAPTRLRARAAGDEFAAGYINFYVCNGAIIAPEFGDARADAAAGRTLQALFPGRDLVQLNIDALAAGGGGIHCTTQQEPKV